MTIHTERMTIRKRVDKIDVEVVTLADLLTDVQRAIELWGGDAVVEEYRDNYSSGYSQGGVFKEVEETDDEYNKRIVEETRWAEQQNDRDLREFQRLSAKFNSK
jgi:hypothetical protein